MMAWEPAHHYQPHAVQSFPACGRALSTESSGLTAPATHTPPGAPFPEPDPSVVSYAAQVAPDSWWATHRMMELIDYVGVAVEGDS